MLKINVESATSTEVSLNVFALCFKSDVSKIVYRNA